MEFRIADTFTDSLARLTGQEQKAVKTTAFDLQLDPVNPGMHFHKLDRAKDPNFWSVRVGADIRLIVHKTASSLLLCYVDHHDPAYTWAERRKIERHPTTGAAQLVEVRERVEEIPVFQPVVVEPLPPTPKSALFGNLRKFEIMSFGVPEEWVEDVRKATEDTLLDIIRHLPQEAQEALLKLAVGETPETPKPAPVDADPFAHPDAQRRFRVLTNVEELERALDFPWEKWTVFLHPDQRQFVERDYSGPVRISGSAGTGKTIVALHRAVLLARRHPQARILLTTFSKALASALKVKLQHLVGNEPAIADRVVVRPITALGSEMYTEAFGPPAIASAELVRSLLGEAAAKVPGQRFTRTFLLGEWTDIVDAWQLRTWEGYRDVTRLGRKTRIGGKQREVLWSIFAEVRAELDQRQKLTWADLFGRLTKRLAGGAARPFEYAVVDEAQDLAVPECRFLAALVSSRPGNLFFAGDLGQRIFQQPFSWKSVGIDLRGRSHTLRLNYRTSHQIRSQADQLLPKSLADVDGNVESRKGTVSVFNGPPPIFGVFPSAEHEAIAVGKWISERLAEGILPHEVGVFVRSDEQLSRAEAAVKAAGATTVKLTDEVASTEGKVAVGSMHLAKGLEFRAVAVMACDDEVLPLQARIEDVADESDLEEVYNTERHLLYVACTRARDFLSVSGVEPASEFLDDFGKAHA
jgi:mRNA-degrading endonuclease RelE of RelBE toxin-antitoxin system